MVIVVDPVYIIVDFLANRPDVMSWAEDRVYGEELDYNRPDQVPPCIVVTASGGISPDWYVPVSNVRFDIKCYGNTIIQCQNVDLAVYAAMKYADRERAGGSLLFSARQESGPFTLRDPDADWPYRLRVYNVMVSERYI